MKYCSRCGEEVVELYNDSLCLNCHVPNNYDKDWWEDIECEEHDEDFYKDKDHAMDDDWN